MPLADFFLQLANGELEKQVKGFDSEARKRLLAYTWGGNVRGTETGRAHGGAAYRRRHGHGGCVGVR